MIIVQSLIMSDLGTIALDLNSYYWLGGSTCSGKTTICDSLSLRFHLDIHHRDDAIAEHWKQANPQNHPSICEWLHLRQAGSAEELLDRSVDDLVSLMISAFREDFSLTLEDLARTNLEPCTIVEGMRLLPEILMPHLEDKDRAVWLVPSFVFCQEEFPAFAA